MFVGLAPPAAISMRVRLKSVCVASCEPTRSLDGGVRTIGLTALVRVTALSVA
ncbi:hypothetical protein D3C83_286250 [compost metagenome]